MQLFLHNLEADIQFYIKKKNKKTIKNQRCRTREQRGRISRVAIFLNLTATLERLEQIFRHKVLDDCLIIDTVL